MRTVVPLTRLEAAALAALLAAALAGVTYRAIALLREDAGGGTITVSVTGAVAVPGRFEMEAGSRLGDLLRAACPLPGADLSSLAADRTLSDGDSVEVPWAGGRAPAPPEPIDVNSAPAWVLERLPGIGPALAEAIVQYRSTHGAFTSLEELDLVPGIGPATVGRLRGLAVARSTGSDASAGEAARGSRPPR